MAVAISQATVTNRATSAVIKWVKPAPLWASQDTPLGQPWLAEFGGDRFLPDFLGLMASQTPADLASDAYKPKLTILDDGKPHLKLYQPLHGRYYLVTGSLVCRKLGLPDRSVERKNGEKTSFVLRRLIIDSNNAVTAEFGWVKDSTVPRGGSWQLVGSSSLLNNEERQPMHPVKTCAPLPLTTGIVPTPVGQTICDQRTVYYGYIPVASREKYLMPIADVIGTLQNIIDAGGSNAPGDPRLDDLSSRVFEPWPSIYISNTPPNPPDEQKDSISFYLLLEMLDFLQINLPTVFNALGTDGSSLNDPAQTKRKALFTELKSIIKNQHQAGTTDATDIFLSDVLNGLKSYLPLVQSQQGIEPANLSAYNLHAAQHDANHDPNNRDWTDVGKNNAAYLAHPGGAFFTLFSAALDEERKERKKNNIPWLTVPNEVKDILKDDPTNGDTYCLRLVYEHDPCAPVVSERSDSFTFAKAVDPDAPARHIRIELPSIKPRDLRKYKRGVGIQSSCEMNKLTNQLMSVIGLKGIDGLKDLTSPGSCPSGPGFSIGWICSFSLQILFIIAFILMFIFLIILNIVFWWIAFFRICFPIPVSKN